MGCAHMGPNDFCAGCAGEKLVAAQAEIERLKELLESDSRHWKFEWHRVAKALQEHHDKYHQACSALAPARCECSPYDAGCTHRWR